MRLGGRTDEIRLGYKISTLDAKVRVGDPGLPSLESTVGVVSLGWVHDQLDSVVVPRNWFRVELHPHLVFPESGHLRGAPRPS
jgi:hypothetical protein